MHYYGIVLVQIVRYIGKTAIFDDIANRRFHLRLTDTDV
ncbi:hypothetical protein ABID22_001916 [Pontibacter aydingkolensis]